MAKKSNKRLTVAQRTEVRDSTYVPPEEKPERCELCEFFWVASWGHPPRQGMGECRAITKRDDILAIKPVHSLGSCELFELREKGIET